MVAKHGQLCCKKLSALAEPRWLCRAELSDTHGSEMAMARAKEDRESTIMMKARKVKQRDWIWKG